MTLQASTQTYGPGARDRRTEARTPTLDGARAALETFYHAFHQRSTEVLKDVWAPDPLVTLDNPLGEIMHGQAEIVGLYRGLFESSARVCVELRDIVEHLSPTFVVFAGREHGTFSHDGQEVPLLIRTSRVFEYRGEALGWRQVHHHGSIDDPAALERYQRAARAGATVRR